MSIWVPSAAADLPSPHTEATSSRLKRFIGTDTLGLLINVTVCAASVQDRDGAKGALLGLFLTTGPATRPRPRPLEFAY